MSRQTKVRGERLPQDSNDSSFPSSPSSAELLRIVGGLPVTRNASGVNPFPYHAQLRIFNRARNSSLTCGGTIVHAWPGTDSTPAQFWVLTAAHCLYLSDDRLSFGVRYWVEDKGQPGAEIEQGGPSWNDTQRLLIFRHPLHSSSSSSSSNLYDVALIRCTVDALPGWMTNPPNAATRTVNFDKLPIMRSGGDSVTIMGFGTTSNAQGVASPTLMFTAGKVSDDNFRTSNPVAFVNVFGESSSRACSGDSGGGCFDLSAPVPIVLGPLCCTTTDSEKIQCLNPSLYSRIDQYMGADSRFSRDVADSPWSKGVRYIIDAYSPTGLRKQLGQAQESADVGTKYDPQETGWEDAGSKRERDVLEDVWLWIADRAHTPLVRTVAIALLALAVLAFVLSYLSKRRERAAKPLRKPRRSP